VGAEAFAVCDGLFDQWHGRAARTRRCELDAIVAEHRMDLIGNGCHQIWREFPRYSGSGLFMKFHVGELRRAVDCYEHVELTLFGPHLSNVDVEEANRVTLELLLRRSIAFDVQQSADAMTLQATVQ
jgi:hypothetical protein